jgi:hypothetical protein
MNPELLVNIEAELAKGLSALREGKNIKYSWK